MIFGKKSNKKISLYDFPIQEIHSVPMLKRNTEQLVTITNATGLPLVCFRDFTAPQLIENYESIRIPQFDELGNASTISLNHCVPYVTKEQYDEEVTSLNNVIDELLEIIKELENR